jgi:hypothetical protein
MRARLHTGAGILALLAMLAGALAHAAVPAAPEHIVRELAQAHLAGQGVYTWFGIRIYEARLYVGDKGFDSANPGAAPFVLDLQYARKLNGSRIADASADQMARIGAGTPAQRDIWLRQMTLLFPDVLEGSHISGVQLPGGGARFYLDGKSIGSIPDPDFARAFFAIWLSPATTAPGLRASLLKNAAPR